MLTAWVLSALPARSQIDSINTRFPTINKICEAIGMPCNTGLTISGCTDVCVTELDTGIFSTTESGSVCQVGGSASIIGACESCQSSIGRRRLDFDGSCSRQYLELFLQQTTPEFISGLATLSEAQCEDVTDDNVFSQMFMSETGRVFCGASGMAPRPAPTDAGTVTPSPSSPSPASSAPSPSSSPNTSPTVSVTSLPTPTMSAVSSSPSSPGASPSSSPEGSLTASTSPDTVATSTSPAVPSTSLSHSTAPEPRRERRPRRNRSFCVRQIRRCIRRPNFRGRFRPGRRNRIVTRCCIHFCRCERTTSRHCLRSCKTSLSFDP